MAQSVANDVDRTGMAPRQNPTYRSLADAARPVNNYDMRPWPRPAA